MQMKINRSPHGTHPCASTMAVLAAVLALALAGGVQHQNGVEADGGEFLKEGIATVAVPAATQTKTRARTRQKHGLAAVAAAAEPDVERVVFAATQAKAPSVAVAVTRDQAGTGHRRGPAAGVTPVSVSQTLSLEFSQALRTGLIEVPEEGDDPNWILDRSDRVRRHNGDLSNNIGCRSGGCGTYPCPYKGNCGYGCCQGYKKCKAGWTGHYCSESTTTTTGTTTTTTTATTTTITTSTTTTTTTTGRWEQTPDPALWSNQSCDWSWSKTNGNVGFYLNTHLPDIAGYPDVKAMRTTFPENGIVNRNPQTSPTGWGAAEFFFSLPLPTDKASKWMIELVEISAQASTGGGLGLGVSALHSSGVGCCDSAPGGMGWLGGAGSAAGSYRETPGAVPNDPNAHGWSGIWKQGDFVEITYDPTTHTNSRSPNAPTLRLNRYDRTNVGTPGVLQESTTIRLGPYASRTMFPYFWSNYSTVQIRMSAIDVGLNSDAYAACSKHNLQASATQEIQTRLKRYYFPSNALKFEDARAACRKHFNWGGDIASIETEEENNFVNKYVLHGKQAWIGCVKNGGSWIWAESESLCFEDNEDWNHILHPSEGAGKCKCIEV